MKCGAPHFSARLIFALILTLHGAGVVVAGDSGIQELLPQLVSDSESPYQEALSEIYVQREYEPLWVSSSEHLNAEGLALLKVLSNAEQIGLNSHDYDQSELHWLQRTEQLFSGDKPVLRANILARFEVVLSKNCLKLLDHVISGRLSPQQVNGKWYLEDHTASLIQVMSDVIDQGIVATLASLAGGHEGYGLLLQTLKQYLKIEADGGWPVIAQGPLLAKGSKDARVKHLRLRLAATGDLNKANDSLLFDQKVLEGVEHFQARHGLSVDGFVGPRTLEALNKPVRSRIRQILINLERRRWMPRTFGANYILVNIPDFRLMAYRQGEPQLTMPVIVGKPMSQTPIFSDMLEYLVFNPFWNVPRSIATEEILPKFQENTNYLQKKNFEVVDSEGEPMEVALLTEENVETGRIRIRQKPGPENALGLVKFMFPNDHAIYLHDTPAGHLFDVSERDFSHGCIRVERPTDLAQFLLQGRWSEEEIRSWLERSERRVVQLTTAIPVYILYLTTWVAEDGALQFRDDLYGHDEQLWTALQPVLSTSHSRPTHPI